jgi:hypothetical protein
VTIQEKTHERKRPRSSWRSEERYRTQSWSISMPQHAGLYW